MIMEDVPRRKASLLLRCNEKTLAVGGKLILPSGGADPPLRSVTGGPVQESVRTPYLLVLPVIHADETVLQVNKEPGRTPQQESRIWAYSSSKRAKSQTRLLIHHFTFQAHSRYFFSLINEAKSITEFRLIYLNLIRHFHLCLTPEMPTNSTFP